MTSGTLRMVAMDGSKRPPLRSGPLPGITYMYHFTVGLKTTRAVLHAEKGFDLVHVGKVGRLL